ncbi:TlpA family protein disulfide reductase [Puia dinghuensis]|nr:hypothetical protein [Puia dinghuensis]
MKKVIIPLLLTVLSGCHDPNKTITGLEGKPMPHFSIQLSDGITKLNTDSIPMGEPIVLFYFGPYCPYSRSQMQEMIDNMSSLQNIRFYLFTRASFQDMQVFYNYFHLQKYPNILVGVESSNVFNNYYNVPGAPYTAIYNTKKCLKQSLFGQSDVNVIRDIALK